LFDLAIIGAGIVGLATGYRYLQRNPASRVVILEKEDTVAAHQTGHNSGVIHSGIYYRPGSLKARNCRIGADALIAFCEEQGIPYERCGKVVVATTDEELPLLQALYERAEANGVPGVELIGPERLQELEPHARGRQALHVPTTGIVDFTRVAAACAREIARAGGELRTGTRVVGLVRNRDHCIVETSGGNVEAARVINCAGLYADRIARLAGADPPIQIVPFRGEYYTLKPDRRHLVRNLIYPVPDPRFPFLGVHFTRRIDGAVEAGPNAVLALAREGYRKSDFRLGEMWETMVYPGFRRLARTYWQVGAGEIWRSLRKPAFVKALQRLVPAITGADLLPGGSGVRAQAVDREGKLVDDFRILHTGSVVHVLNAPSPAATAAFAIADEILSFMADD
jgi:L-2-hydroxyglutarate oxidase LhgO